MNIHLTQKSNGDRITLSLLPDAVKEKASVNFQTYNFINVGEVKTPAGKKARTYSWSGVLPGKKLKGQPFIKTSKWIAPKEAVKKITKWAEGKKRLVLLVTETSINAEVYISSFEPTVQGGSGSVSYSITLTEAADTIIKVTKKGKKKAKSTKAKSSKRAASKKSSKKRYHTVKKTDTLWSLAQKYYKKGSKYKTIYTANKKAIDKKNKGKKVTKYTIWEGTKLYIPKG
ncbi:MAG: LysM peptidoglycan-binding domain-containing protein [Ruminococcus sp.]